MKKKPLLFLLSLFLLASCGGKPVVSSSDVSSLEPSPTSEPAPSTSEPTIETSEPAPQTSESIPEISEPTPATSEPTIETSEPAPATSEPAPQTSEPTSVEPSSEPISSDEISSEGKSSEEPISSAKSESISISSSEKEDDRHLYNDYYAALSTWENGEDLKAKLHDIIHGGTYQPITYSGTYTNWFSNQEADQDLYLHDSLDALYSKESIRKSATQSSWQREHAWCASLMTGSTTGNAVKYLGRATDFHNLFAAGTSGNTSRGNKNYGVADPKDFSYKSLDDYAYDSKTFEPSDYDKGRVARAIFYMATMYSEDEYDDKNNVHMKGLQVVEGNVDYVSGDSCAFAIGHLSDLLSWSELPVDYLEVQHNESVYSYVPPVHSHEESNVAQGNRNPYVDFPGLVEYAFGAKKDEPGNIADVLSSYELLEMDKEEIAFYAVDSLKREYEEGEPFSKDDLQVVAVNRGLSATPFADFSVSGAKEGEPFGGSSPQITVTTPLNEITYTVKVETDPAFSATWNAAMPAKSGGGAFAPIYNQAGVTHEITIGEIPFLVRWEKGEVSTTSSKYGVKFGANASSPVGSITFETKNEFAFDGASVIDGLYLRGAASSKHSHPVDFYIGDTLIATKRLTYDPDTALTIGSKAGTPASGKAKFVLRSLDAPIYIQRLAIAAH